MTCANCRIYLEPGEFYYLLNIVLCGWCYRLLKEHLAAESAAETAAAGSGGR